MMKYVARVAVAADGRNIISQYLVYDFTKIQADPNITPFSDTKSYIQ